MKWDPILDCGEEPIDRLLPLLDGVRESGKDRWVARCPAHDDQKPSFSIRELPDGTLLIHCFAGCSAEEVLTALGLEFQDLYPGGAMAHFRRQRKPWSVREVIAALEFELMVAFIVLADVAAGRPVDRERAKEGTFRIARFLEELRNAGR